MRKKRRKSKASTQREYESEDSSEVLRKQRKKSKSSTPQREPSARAAAPEPAAPEPAVQPAAVQPAAVAAPELAVALQSTGKTAEPRDQSGLTDSQFYPTMLELKVCCF